MKANKRGSKKVKASPVAVNLGAWLRFYAPDNETHSDAIRKAQGANQRGLGAVGQCVGAGVKSLANKERGVDR